MVILQPCDWHEHDVTNRKVKGYVVDVYGRTEDGMVACLRITGFNPYFYCGGSDPGGATQVKKYDVFAAPRQVATIVKKSITM